jgi:hypothetical protein
MEYVTLYMFSLCLKEQEKGKEREEKRPALLLMSTVLRVFGDEVQISILCVLDIF